jgi:3-keto-disaccharide hydrolase
MKAVNFILLSAVSSVILAAQSDFVSLMPVRQIAEHWLAEGAPADIWTLKDGVIVCAGKPNGFLRSRKSYRNYVFRAEWRFEPNGWVGAPAKWPNAGFFIHAGEVKDGWPTSLEVQGHYGEAGSVFGVRGGKITGAKRGPIVKNRIPFGDWDRYEVTSRDGNVRVILNGELVNEGTGAQPSEGNICLQSEGWEVHYRNVAIKELP